MDILNKSTELTIGQTEPQALTLRRPQTEPNSKKWQLVKLKAFYGGFYQTAMGENEMLQISEVVDLLAVFTNEEIQHGLQQYHIAGPRTQAGYLRKPAAGDLYQFLMNIRGSKPQPDKSEPEPEIDAPTSEQKRRANELISNLGFSKRVLGTSNGNDA